MVKAATNNSDEQEFWKNASTKFEEKVQYFSQTLNIAVIGKVSSGKSSRTDLQSLLSLKGIIDKFI